MLGFREVINACTRIATKTYMWEEGVSSVFYVKHFGINITKSVQAQIFIIIIVLNICTALKNVNTRSQVRSFFFFQKYAKVASYPGASSSTKEW
jgi:hypothetical protein